MAEPLKTKRRYKGEHVNTKRKAIRVETRRDAWAMRRQGKTIRQIAEALGIARGTAHNIITQELEEIAGDQREIALHWRAEHIQQLEEIQGAHLEAAALGDVRAGEMVLKIKQELAKLQGCYAPIKTELSADVMARGYPNLQKLSDEDLNKLEALYDKYASADADKGREG